MAELSVDRIYFRREDTNVDQEGAEYTTACGWRDIDTELGRVPR